MNALSRQFRARLEAVRVREGVKRTILQNRLNVARDRLRRSERRMQKAQAAEDEAIGAAIQNGITQALRPQWPSRPTEIAFPCTEAAFRRLTRAWTLYKPKRKKAHYRTFRMPVLPAPDNAFANLVLRQHKVRFSHQFLCRHWRRFSRGSGRVSRQKTGALRWTRHHTGRCGLQSYRGLSFRSSTSRTWLCETRRTRTSSQGPGSTAS